MKLIALVLASIVGLALSFPHHPQQNQQTWQAPNPDLRCSFGTDETKPLGFSMSLACDDGVTTYTATCMKHGGKAVWDADFKSCPEFRGSESSAPSTNTQQTQHSQHSQSQGSQYPPHTQGQTYPPHTQGQTYPPSTSQNQYQPQYQQETHSQSQAYEQAQMQQMQQLMMMMMLKDGEKGEEGGMDLFKMMQFFPQMFQGQGQGQGPMFGGNPLMTIMMSKLMNGGAQGSFEEFMPYLSMMGQGAMNNIMNGDAIELGKMSDIFTQGPFGNMLNQAHLYSSGPFANMFKGGPMEDIFGPLSKLYEKMSFNEKPSFPGFPGMGDMSDNPLALYMMMQNQNGSG